MKNDVSNRFTVNELQALKSCLEDAKYFKNMYLQILGSPISELLINGFYSETSMFVTESYDCLTKIDPKMKVLLDSTSIKALRQSRHRAKLLESKKNINEGIDILKSINESEINKFQIHHTGLFSKVTKFFQPDMAITKYQKSFITTSHSTIFDLGPEVRLEKEYLLSFGESIGTYLQTLIELFEVGETDIDRKYICKKNNYQMIDVKSKSLFERSKFQENNKKFSPALILVLVRLNYTKLITIQFLPKNSHALLRVKFINAYHAYSSLNKIQSLVMKNHPSAQEKLFFESLFSNDEIKRLLNNTSLRNLFTHYLLEKYQLKILPNTFTREEAIVTLSKGLSYEEIGKLLDKYIGVITTAIEGFFELDDNTFWINRIDNEL